MNRWKNKFGLFFTTLLVGILALVGCDPYEEEKLVGEWQASYISENGQPLNIDYTPINFMFTTDGFYHFNSTIDYKEAGTYYLNGDLLFTLDTLNSASSEKAVQVMDLTEDSLHLKMMANGKDKLMKLYRVKQ